MRCDATGIDRAVGGLDSWLSNYNIIMVAVAMVTILLVGLSRCPWEIRMVDKQIIVTCYTSLMRLTDCIFRPYNTLTLCEV